MNGETKTVKLITVIHIVIVLRTQLKRSNNVFAKVAYFNYYLFVTFLCYSNDFY